MRSPDEVAHELVGEDGEARGRAFVRAGMVAALGWIHDHADNPMRDMIDAKLAELGSEDG